MRSSGKTYYTFTDFIKEHYNEDCLIVCEDKRGWFMTLYMQFLRNHNISYKVHTARKTISHNDVTWRFRYLTNPAAIIGTRSSILYCTPTGYEYERGIDL